MAIREYRNRLDRLADWRGDPRRPVFVGLRFMTGTQWEAEQAEAERRIKVEGLPAVTGKPAFTGMTLIVSDDSVPPQSVMIPAYQ